MQVVKMISALVLSAAVVLSVSASTAPAVVAAPKVSASPTPVAAVPTTASIPESPQVLWVRTVIKNAGLPYPTNLTVHVTDGQGNCGSERSAGGVGGACTQRGIEHNYVVVDMYVSPSIIHTPAGIHEVLHEMAHVEGMADECSAERFAHEREGNSSYWAYPECKQ